MMLGRILLLLQMESSAVQMVNLTDVQRVPGYLLKNRARTEDGNNTPLFLLPIIFL